MNPLVIDAPLDDEIARPRRPLLPAIQPQHYLAGDHGRVVEGLRTVHDHGEGGLDVGGAEPDAGGWAAGDGGGLGAG